MKNKVQLITYPDSLGGNLKSLERVISGYFSDVFEGGIHILPPFPSSGDRGFAPIDYFKIAPEFGTWEDIKKLGETYDLMVDLMVNHISKQSTYFQDYLANENQSEYADMFITKEKVWKEGEPSKEDLEKIFFRRNSPFSTYQTKNNNKMTVWTTFGHEDPSEQIDLDVFSTKTEEYQKNILTCFAKNNIKHVRLDAVGYVVKKQGTSCFFIQPEIYQYMDKMKGLAENLGLEILPEVHAEKKIQYDLSNRGYLVYDFILPYLILSSLILQNNQALLNYLTERPVNQITLIDCHDGIPVLPDLEGHLNVEEAREVIGICVERGGNLSKIISEKPLDFDVHQINGTLYSLLGKDDDAYIMARAIQFFVPGIPQLYYVGLLAGENDPAALSDVDGRIINRHNYSEEEIKLAIKKNVVQRLVRLIQLRNAHPAFKGSFSMYRISLSEFELRWIYGNETIVLNCDLKNYISKVIFSKNGSLQTIHL